MSRILYYVTNPGEFKSFWEIFALWRGGLVAYGGFLGGFLGSVIYLRRQKFPLWPWADVAAPSLASGLMLTRIGCYLFGCDFGKPLPFGAPEWLKTLGTFPHWPEGTLPHGSGSPAWVQHVQHNLLNFDSAASLPVHPTQIYESLVGAGLLALLLWVRKNLRFRGQVFLVFTFAYGVLRFLLEMIRDDLERGEFGPHIPEHILIAGGLVIFAGAYAVFMAPSVAEPTMRKLTQIVAFVPAVVFYLVMRPPSFGDQTLVQLSTSQWVAILTAVPAAVAYAIYFKAAQAHPESAMALNLEEFYKLHPEALPGAGGDDSEPKRVEAASRDEKSAEAPSDVKETSEESKVDPEPGKEPA
jgi:phosphatidylglycerol:prolipoprotein diacylglycerol transferase